jgi:hypothetical protein
MRPVLSRALTVSTQLRYVAATMSRASQEDRDVA